MKTKWRCMVLFAFINVGGITAGYTSSVNADIVNVTINGEVEYNQVNSGFLGGVNPGDSAVLTFNLDSNDFVNSGANPTRGYVIDMSSFQLTFAGNSIGMQNPFPGGLTPYFVLRDNDPAVDGFFTSTSVDVPNGVPIDQVGIFGNFASQFSVTYGDDPLSSLDILDALGTYDFTGLTVFNYTVDDGPFQPVGMIFENMTLARVPEPAVLLPLFCVCLALMTRREKK